VIQTLSQANSKAQRLSDNVGNRKEKMKHLIIILLTGVCSLTQATKVNIDKHNYLEVKLPKGFSSKVIPFHNPAYPDMTDIKNNGSVAVRFKTQPITKAKLEAEGGLEGFFKTHANLYRFSSIEGKANIKKLNNLNGLYAVFTDKNDVPKGMPNYCTSGAIESDHAILMFTVYSLATNSTDYIETMKMIDSGKLKTK
jgi:hypothetical protein